MIWEMGDAQCVRINPPAPTPGCCAAPLGHPAPTPHHVWWRLLADRVGLLVACGVRLLVLLTEAVDVAVRVAAEVCVFVLVCVALLVWVALWVRVEVREEVACGEPVACGVAVLE